MDITLARTFLTIVETGSFVSASHRLHVTPSTVSTRIRTLEDLLGKALFTRNNSSCELTRAGRRFERHARLLVRGWQEARHELAVPDRFTDALALGGQYSLWDGFLLTWLQQARQAMPATALRVTAGVSRRLLEELFEGVLDVVVVHSPELRAGLHVEPLLEDHLILVNASSTRDYRERYMYFDWGDAFRAMHADQFPDVHSPGFALELGPIGLEALLAHDGAGYLPERLARDALAAGRLHRVAGAPTFLHPAYIAMARDAAERPAVRQCVELLHSSVPASPDD